MQIYSPKKCVSKVYIHFVDRKWLNKKKNRVWCFSFCLMFYLSRSRSPRYFCSSSFLHLGSPAFRIEWYGVNVGFSSLGIRKHCLEFLYLNFLFTYHLGLDINIPNCCISKKDSAVIGQAGIEVYIHNSIADITHRRQYPVSDLAECIWLKMHTHTHTHTNTHTLYKLMGGGWWTMFLSWNTLRNVSWVCFWKKRE